MSEPPFVCPLCGGKASTVVRYLNDATLRSTTQLFPLVCCVRCGLLRLHPQPDAATLAAAYGSGYAPHNRPGVSGWAKSRLERRSARLLWRWLGQPRRVLDVGCATGELLLSIRAAGNLSVIGVEPGELAAQRARERGLDVFTGTLEAAALPTASVDTVIMSHTLEHVSDPIATLLEANRVLRPSGALILWLPNVDSIEARVLGNYWIGYDAPRHLTTFGARTLAGTLRAAGFRAIDVRHEAIGLEWAWALRLWVRSRWPSAAPVLAAIHPLLIVLATPLAAIGALTGRSGRIRVVAETIRT